MANDNTNPFTNPIFKIENIEFDIRRVVQILFDMTDNGHMPGNLSLDYVASALYRHVNELEQAHKELMAGLLAIDPVAGDRRAV